MTDRTGVPAGPGGFTPVPWSDGEKAANKALVTHFAGCRTCKGGKAECDTGNELLADLKAATLAAREAAHGC